MLKELEEKAILNPVEKEHVEPKAVKIDLDDYDNDIFVQDIIPEEDYIELYKECIYEITDVLDDYRIIVQKVLLDKYTNIDADVLSRQEINKIFDDIEYAIWYEQTVVYNLFDDIERYFKVFLFKNILKETFDEYFTDTVAKNALEELEKDLESLDMDKIKNIFQAFGVANGLKLGG